MSNFLFVPVTKRGAKNLWQHKCDSISMVSFLRSLRVRSFVLSCKRTHARGFIQLLVYVFMRLLNCHSARACVRAFASFRLWVLLVPDGSRPEWAFSSCYPTGYVHHSIQSPSCQVVLSAIAVGGLTRPGSTLDHSTSTAWSQVLGCQSRPKRQGSTHYTTARFIVGAAFNWVSKEYSALFWFCFASLNLSLKSRNTFPLALS